MPFLCISTTILVITKNEVHQNFSCTFTVTFDYDTIQVVKNYTTHAMVRMIMPHFLD